MSKIFKKYEDRLGNNDKDKRVIKPERIFPAIDRIWEKGHPEADSIGMGHAMNKHLRWRKGFMYCFSGWPGAGKSEFVNYIAVQKAKKDKTKVAMYSPENYPIEYLVEDLMRVYTGKSIEYGYNNRCTPEELEEAKQFVNKYFRLIQFDDIPNYLDVANEFQRLAEDEGFEMFILDPFNSILTSNEMMSQYFQAALTQMKMLATNTKGYVVLIEHPKRENTKDGQRANPSPWILYGGSMWWNKSDVIVTLDRDLESTSGATELKVWKVKRQRQNGTPGIIELEYNRATSQFTVLTKDPIL